MYLEELMSTVRNRMTVQTAFGEPIERDGVTVLPVCLVSGGGGAGGGKDEKGAEGDGGGYGMCVQPVGAYLISDGKVRFKPVINVNQLAGTVAKVFGVAVFAWARTARRRKRGIA